VSAASACAVGAPASTPQRSEKMALHLADGAPARPVDELSRLASDVTHVCSPTVSGPNMSRPRLAPVRTPSASTSVRFTPEVAGMVMI
jgi:hypothetical protein